MLEQRTLHRPGEGIYKEPPPTTRHAEYPKHMVHGGYQPGVVGEEVVFGDPNRPAFRYNKPGTSIRFPPVLAMDADQEEYHVAQGYVSQGKSDASAFARAVAVAPAAVENRIPIEYPKWVNGTEVKNAEEEAEVLGRPSPPAVPVVLDTNERLAALEAENARLRAMVEARPNEPAPAPQATREPELTRSEKIKAGIARKKLEKQAAALPNPEIPG